MKIEVTKAQLEAIKSIADDISTMIGCGDDDSKWKHNVKMVDDMLSKNGLKPRDFK